MRFFGFLLVFTCGCGLSDYEKRMDTQRERLKHFDEENRLLGEPLKMPKLINKAKDEVDAFPFEIFLRPPNEIKDEPGKAPYVFDGVMLVRYRGSEGNHLLLGASPVAEKSAAGTGEQSGETPEEFQRKILGAFKDYHRTVYMQDVTPPTAGEREFVEPLSFKGPWPRMELDRYLFVDKGVTKADFRIYFYRRGPNQVAVIYQVPSDKERDSRKAIDYSLKTLAIEPEKVRERQEEYNLRARFRP